MVLDAFAGTGTTCVAAKRMGLRWIGIDRVPKYADLARTRVGQTVVDGGPDLRVGFLKWPKVEGAEAEKVEAEKATDVSDAAAAASDRHNRRLGATTTLTEAKDTSDRTTKVEAVSHRPGSTVTATTDAVREQARRNTSVGRTVSVGHTDGERGTYGR
jgi:hypothetical protein